MTTMMSDSFITWSRLPRPPRYSSPRDFFSSGLGLRLTARICISKAWSLLATSMPMLPMPIIPAFLPLRATPGGPPRPVLNVLCLGITRLARARMRASAPSARGVGLAPEVLATRTSGLKASKGMSSTPAPVFWRSLRLDAALATSDESRVAKMTSASAPTLPTQPTSPCLPHLPEDDPQVRLMFRLRF